MRYERDGKIIDIPDNDVKLAKRMIGMPEDGPDSLPEKFLSHYLEMQALVRRVGVNRIGVEGLAMLCMLSKIPAAPDNKHQWLIDMITGRTLKTVDMIDVDFRNSVVSGKYHTADLSKEIVVVEVEGQERKLPFSAVKQKGKK